MRKNNRLAQHDRFLVSDFYITPYIAPVLRTGFALARCTGCYQHDFYKGILERVRNKERWLALGLLSFSMMKEMGR